MAKFRTPEPHLPRCCLKRPLVVPCPGVGPLRVGLIAPGLAQGIRFRLQKTVQRLLHALAHDLGYMCPELPLVHLDDRAFPFLLFNAIFRLAALLAGLVVRKPILTCPVGCFHFLNVRNFLYVICWSAFPTRNACHVRFDNGQEFTSHPSMNGLTSMTLGWNPCGRVCPQITALWRTSAASSGRSA